MIEITKGVNMQVNVEEIIKIQPRGVLTIPKTFRKIPGFDENCLIRLREEKGRVVMEPVRTLPYPVRSYSKEDLKEFFTLDDKESEMMKKSTTKAK